MLAHEKFTDKIGLYERFRREKSAYINFLFILINKQFNLNASFQSELNVIGSDTHTPKYWQISQLRALQIQLRAFLQSTTIDPHYFHIHIVIQETCIQIHFWKIVLIIFY